MQLTATMLDGYGNTVVGLAASSFNANVTAGTAGDGPTATFLITSLVRQLQQHNYVRRREQCTCYLLSESSVKGYLCNTGGSRERHVFAGFAKP
jgi:hypothetical protein